MPKAAFSAAKSNLLVEDSTVRRCRHRRAKGEQADRARQGRLPARQHQLGAGAGDGQRVASRKRCSMSSRAATPTRSPARNCHWDVFRICNTTQHGGQCGGRARCIKNAGKKWYYITPDYAFGHTLQVGPRRRAESGWRHRTRRRLHAARHHRFLRQPDQGAGGEPGCDHLALWRATTWSTRSSRRCSSASTRSMHFAGAQQELEVLLGLPPEARSAPGCSSGTGSNRACRMSKSSSPTSARRAAATFRQRAPGSALPST